MDVDMGDKLIASSGMVEAESAALLKDSLETFSHKFCSGARHRTLPTQIKGYTPIHVR